MKEQTKVALTQAGFAYYAQTRTWERSPSFETPDSEHLVEWRPEQGDYRLHITVTDESLPVVLAALTTPAAHALTRDERLARVTAIEGSYAHVPRAPEDDTLTEEQLARAREALDGAQQDVLDSEDWGSARGVVNRMYSGWSDKALIRLRNQGNQEGVPDSD